MKVAIIYQPNNRLFRTDGNEFGLRALDAMRFYIAKHDAEIEVLRLPKKNPTQVVRQFLEGIEDHSIDRLLVFAHGTRSWCEPFGSIYSVISCTMFDMVKFILAPNARIGLYCCLCGDMTRDGFAAVMHESTDAILLANMSSSPWSIRGGHTTRNPYKRAFDENSCRDLRPTVKADQIEWKRELDTDPWRPFEILEGL